MATIKLSEEQANQMVFKALDFIGIDDVRKFERDEYYKDVDSITYSLYYNKRYKEQIFMKIKMEQYYDLMRQGLTLSGYEVKRIKRKIIDGIFTYYITFTNELELAGNKKL